MVWGSSYFFSWADPFYADLSFYLRAHYTPLLCIYEPIGTKDYSSYHIDRRQPSLTVRHLLVKPIQVSPLGTMPCNVLCDTMLPVRQPVRYDSKYESCYENLLFYSFRCFYPLTLTIKFYTHQLKFSRITQNVPSLLGVQ